MSKKLPIITALLLKLATVGAFAQQTPTVEAIEQIVFECFTQHTHHLQQARQAVARGETSPRRLYSPETDSVRLSALAADFHADCIKDTLQTRYGDSEQGISLVYTVPMRDGVYTGARADMRAGVGNIPWRDQSALTNMHLEDLGGYEHAGATDMITNIDLDDVSNESWLECMGIDIGIESAPSIRVFDFMGSGYFERARESSFSTVRGISPGRNIPHHPPLER